MEKPNCFPCTNPIASSRSNRARESLHKESSDGEESRSLPIRYPFGQGKVGQTLHSQGLGRPTQDLMEFPSTSLPNSALIVVSAIYRKMAGRKMADFRFACAPARLKAPEGSSSFCPSSFCKTIRGGRNDDQCPKLTGLSQEQIAAWSTSSPS
jgi:hypothetical protein